MSKVKDYLKKREYPSDDINDIKVRVLDIQDRVYDLIGAMNTLTVWMEQTMNDSRDAKIRIREMQDIVHDLQVRVLDTQNQSHNLISKTEDIKVRTKDTQDRIYDSLWQQKTSTHQRDTMFWHLFKKEGESELDAKKRFFLEMPKAQGTTRLIQELMISLLKKVDHVCKQNNLNYWIDFGALIGAVRHKGCIPWDDDIDLGMMREDALKLEEILRKDESVKVRHVIVNRGDGNGAHCVMQVRWNDLDQEGLLNNLDIFKYDYCDERENMWDAYQEERLQLVELSKALPTTIPRNENEEEYPEIYEELHAVFDQAVKEADARLGITFEKNKRIIFAIDNCRILISVLLVL